MLKTRKVDVLKLPTVYQKIKKMCTYKPFAKIFSACTWISTLKYWVKKFDLSILPEAFRRVNSTIDGLLCVWGLPHAPGCFSRVIVWVLVWVVITWDTYNMVKVEILLIINNYSPKNVIIIWKSSYKIENSIFFCSSYPRVCSLFDCLTFCYYLFSGTLRHHSSGATYSGWIWGCWVWKEDCRCVLNG